MVVRRLMRTSKFIISDVEQEKNFASKKSESFMSKRNSRNKKSLPRVGRRSEMMERRWINKLSQKEAEVAGRRAISWRWAIGTLIQSRMPANTCYQQAIVISMWQSYILYYSRELKRSMSRAQIIIWLCGFRHNCLSKATHISANMVSA